MIERWKNMSRGDRLRLQLVIIFLMIALYGLVLYLPRKNKLDDVKKMLHRRQDRIEKRADISKLGDDGLNAKTISKKIAKVEAEIEALQETFNELDTGFAPMDSSEMRQQLMLEISTLASRTGVTLFSVSRKGASANKASASQVLDLAIGRPLLNIKAGAGYWDILAFIRGLNDLSFYVAVMNLKVSTTPPREDQRYGDQMSVNTLFVSLELSM